MVMQETTYDNVAKSNEENQHKPEAASPNQSNAEAGAIGADSMPWTDDSDDCRNKDEHDDT